jgi:uncharacterized membrane protein YjdF
LIYLAISYLLFILSPMDWKVPNIDILSMYVFSIFLVITIFFLFGANRNVVSSERLKFKRYIWVGGLFALSLITPATLLYSGKYPWQFVELWADQQQAYTIYQERLAQSTTAQRAPLALSRVLAHPFVFSVVPLCILNWRSLRLVHKSILAATIICAVIVSLSRGTDRETADIVIFLLACLLIAQARNRVFRDGSGSERRFARRKMVSLSVLLGVLAIIVFYVFVERKLARYSGDATALCAGSSADICISSQSPLWEVLGAWGTFAVAITSSYMSQGFYGLSLAMGLDFQSTFGTGISPLMARLYEALSGNTEMYMRSYTFRLRELGWSDENAWSTLMIWFANDLGFVGALLPLGFLSYIFGASWRDAVMARDDSAAIVFVMLFLMFIYLPANNQIGQSPDLSYTFVFWFALWKWGKRKAAHALPAVAAPMAAASG